MSRMKMFFILLLLWVPLTLAAAVTVDINTADSAIIAEHVKGIGDKKAAAIIRYREQHGLFSSVDDLTKVKGIGQKTVEINRKILTASQQ